MPKRTKKTAYKARKTAKKVKKAVAAPKLKRTRTRKDTEETKPVVVKPKAKKVVKKKAPFCACAKAPALSALAYVVGDNMSKSATIDEVAEGTSYDASMLEVTFARLVRKGFAAKISGGKFKLTQMGKNFLKRHLS
tara:strand:+ start:1068 stop:1475 length:408 start_codon:yes stop_codon:yes gene_type:complete